MANLADYTFIYETENKVDFKTQLMLKLSLTKSRNVQGSLSVLA